MYVLVQALVCDLLGIVVGPRGVGASRKPLGVAGKPGAVGPKNWCEGAVRTPLVGGARWPSQNAGVSPRQPGQARKALVGIARWPSQHAARNSATSGGLEVRVACVDTTSRLQPSQSKACGVSSSVCWTFGASLCSWPRHVCQDAAALVRHETRNVDGSTRHSNGTRTGYRVSLSRAAHDAGTPHACA